MIINGMKTNTLMNVKYAKREFLFRPNIVGGAIVVLMTLTTIVHISTIAQEVLTMVISLNQ